MQNTILGVAVAAACGLASVASAQKFAGADLVVDPAGQQLSGTAVTLYVNTATDSVDAFPGDGVCANADGACSLRAAIQESNTSARPHVVVLERKVYRLTIDGAYEDASASGDLDILGDVFLQGHGAVIDANDTDRAFDVFAGGRLIMTESRIVNGAPPATQSGGGIRSAGATSLHEVSLVNNTVTGAGASGGAVFNAGGKLLVANSVMRNNAAARAGGAIEANAGLTTLMDTNLIDNETGPMPGNGGGLHLTGAGTVKVDGGVVSGNLAAAEGGGLWNSAVGIMLINDLIMSDNEATGDAADNGGGALFNDGGTMTVDRSAIKGNRATGASGSGGGILNNAGVLKVRTSTLEANTASRAGGGIESNIGENVLVDTNLIANFTGPSPGNGGGLHITGAGSAEVHGGLVEGNTAAAEGGGLWNGSGTMYVVDTRVTGNVAEGVAADQGGGGLFNNGGSLEVVGATIDSNSAPAGSGSGGGIFNDQGSLLVSSTNVIDNASQRAGGGIEANAGDTTLLDVLLYNNRTGAAPGNGGGLHLTGAGSVSVDDSGVFANDASNEGGGLWNSSTGTMTVTGTETDGNTSPDGPDVFNDGGTFTIDGVPVPAG